MEVSKMGTAKFKGISQSQCAELLFQVLRVQYYFGRLVLLDIWLLLYSLHYFQHILTTRFKIILLMIISAMAIGVLMQKSKSYPLLELASHKIIMEHNIEDENAMKWCDKYGKNIYQLSSDTGISIYMKQINADHQRDINILRKKIQTLQYSSNMLKKALQIQSSLFSQQIEKSHKDCNMFQINEASIRKLIDDEIARYDADKLAMPDYALETSGGSIISIPDTLTYEHKTWISFWGINLFRINKNTPRNIIQGSLEPGNCWAFYGSNGKVIIELSAIIQITAVTLEHISAKISTSGNINSAPKYFAVHGLSNDSTIEIHLGTFMYDINGPTRQTFQTSKGESKNVFKEVKLSVFSNYGHPEYTCIYRFRVHGNLYSEPIKKE